MMNIKSLTSYKLSLVSSPITFVEATLIDLRIKNMEFMFNMVVGVIVSLIGLEIIM